MVKAKWFKGGQTCWSADHAPSSSDQPQTTSLRGTQGLWMLFLIKWSLVHIPGLTERRHPITPEASRPCFLKKHIKEIFQVT